MSLDDTAQNGPSVSDERIRNALRKHIKRAIDTQRLTRAELANDSGVSIYTIDAIISHDAAKKRRVAMEDGLSLAHALGKPAVNAILALFGWTGHALDEEAELQPMMIAATAMQHLSTIATAAADGRIDHTEAPACQDAADFIIATVKPLSSLGRSA